MNKCVFQGILVFFGLIVFTCELYSPPLYVKNPLLYGSWRLLESRSGVFESTGILTITDSGFTLYDSIPIYSNMTNSPLQIVEIEGLVYTYSDTIEFKPLYRNQYDYEPANTVRGSSKPDYYNGKNSSNYFFRHLNPYLYTISGDTLLLRDVFDNSRVIRYEKN